MISDVLHQALRAVVVCSLLSASCGGKDVPSPPSGGSGGDVQISGGERLGWSQPAANPAELAGFQYAMYVDGNRSVLSGVSCGTVATSAGFDCTAPLPIFTAGS